MTGRALAAYQSRGWDGIPVGSPVTVRARGGFRFDAETASEPFEDHGFASIRLRIGSNAVYTERLVNVSLGQTPAPPAVRIASALRPVPTSRGRLTWTEGIALGALFYFIAFGLYSICAWVMG